MKAFHAYDIRGVYNSDFNRNDVYKIGFFLPGQLKAKKILIGMDCRLSSMEILEALSNGIRDAGADVYYAGLSTTPMIYWSTAKFNFDASVMITASHNAKQYNGLKVSKRGALPVGYDNGLKSIEEKILNNNIVKPEKQKGAFIEYEVKDEYEAFLKKYKSDFGNLKIAIDCSNGMAGLLVKNILGKNHHYINFEPDGNFPNHDPNPLNPANIIQLQELVKTQKSDVGVIFDGDADRVMFIDEKGNFVSPDLIIALLGHYFLEGKSPQQNILQDIRTSKSVGKYLEQFGAVMHTWKVGRAFAALKLREIDGLYGGELAGHYYFRDFYYSDSGLLASLIVLQVVSAFKNKGLSMSSLIGNIKSFENSGEINFRVNNKELAMEEVRKTVLKKDKPIAFYNFDGYRIEFEDWWFNIRPSNTEPYLRLLVEANTSVLLLEKVQEIEAIIKKFE